MKLNKRQLIDKSLVFLIYFAACLVVFLLVGIIFYVFKEGISTISFSFLTSVTSVLDGKMGIAGNIVNTLLLIILTMLIAIPISVGSAIYLNEYAKASKLVALIEYAIEILAGIPSIIFGLFGMFFFGETCGLGYSILTGSLTLFIMLLPLLTKNSKEALKTVPTSYRFAAIGLGSGKWHMIKTIVLPNALSGIMSGVILAIGRIVAESAALLFTAGSAKDLPKNLLDILYKIKRSGGSLTIQMYLAATSEGNFKMAFGIAVVLITIILIINIITKLLARSYLLKVGGKYE